MPAALPDLETWQQWRSTLPSLPAQVPARAGIKAALLECQQDRCALCLAAGLFLVLDHEHLTGLARGMLCRSCNTREGSCPAGAEPVVDAYRASPPASGAAWPWSPPVPARPSQARRTGRPRGPQRVPVSFRILAEQDRRLTAAVEMTGQPLSYVVDAALNAYFDAQGIPSAGGAP